MPSIGAHDAGTLLDGISSFWGRRFADNEFLKDALRASETFMAQVYLDSISQIMKSTIKEVPVYDLELLKLVILCTDDFTLNASTGYYDVALPDNLVDTRFLQSGLVDPDVIYENGYEFIIDREARVISFTSNIHSPVANGLPFYTDDDGAVYIALWALDALVDNDTLKDRYGVLFDIESASSEAYRTQLRGIWQLYVGGPTLSNMRTVLSAIVGLPVSLLDADTVVSVNTATAAGTVIVTERTSYAFSPALGVNPAITAGYVLDYLEPLTDVFTVTDYVDDPDWWEDQVIPQPLCPDLSIPQRRSRSAWYGTFYGGVDETITAWMDEAETDLGAAGVVAGDILWVGASGSEIPYTITQVNDERVQFTPAMPVDVTEASTADEQRYSIGSAANKTLRTAVRTDGISLRIGGTYYGQIDIFYGGLRHHNLAWNLWYYLLKYHVFAVIYDDDELPADTNLQLLYDVVNEGKPGYTYALIANWTDLADTVNPDDDLTLAVSVSLSETMADGDSALEYGSGASYDDMMVYYGMMDRDFTSGALAGPPATSPAAEESAYSATIEAGFEHQPLLLIDGDESYTLSSGVINDTGKALYGYELHNAGTLTAFDDLLATPSIYLAHSATSSAYEDTTDSSPRLEYLYKGTLDAQLKLDVTNLAAVADTLFTLAIKGVVDNDDWAGCLVTFNGLGDCTVSSLNTSSGTTSITATTNLGGLTTMWVRLVRSEASWTTVSVYCKANDGDAWTHTADVTNANIDSQTVLTFALSSSAGSAVEISIVEFNVTGRVS